MPPCCRISAGRMIWPFVDTVVIGMVSKISSYHRSVNAVSVEERVVPSPQYLEWKTLKGDFKAALAGGEHALLEIVKATHAGMTTERFERIVKDWLDLLRMR
jgi:hypothetical protein